MPTIAEFMRTAIGHHKAGHLKQAEDIYQSILHSAPDYPDALHSLGLIAQQKGEHYRAVEFVRRAITANPQIPQFHNTLGLILESLGKFTEAITVYRSAINLAPDYAQAYHNMAIAYLSVNDYAAVVENCRKVISLNPDFAQGYNTFAYALQMQGKFPEAIENFTKAIQLNPDYAEAYNHLGVVLNAQSSFHEAIENYSRAIQIDPDYAEAHWNLALVLLLTGDLVQGFKEYQWRRSRDIEMFLYPHHYDQPRWDGSSFTGKRLLIHYEQGYGDTIHFIRYLPMVKAKGGTVILEIRKPLYDILSNFPGVDELIEANAQQAPEINFDFHASLMDLPLLLNTTTETIPAEVPYIYADSVKLDYWRDKITTDSFKVGIVWSGSQTYERNHVRSCTLEHFSPLAAINGVKLYALQKGPAVYQIEKLEDKIPVVNLGQQFHDFSDTAAAIENLDLIISVDTSVPHLAAAMGKPVWVLLCTAPEWRWMLKREDNPWYPTMRLFRQEKAGDWDGVFQHVAEQLKILIEKQMVINK